MGFYRKVIKEKMIEDLKLYTTTFIKFLFFFPATFLHELAHLILAVLTMSKIHEFKVFPKIIKNPKNPNIIYIEYGYVAYENIISLAKIIISLAPILLWILCFFYMIHINLFYMNFNSLEFNFNQNFLNDHSAFSLMLHLYVIGQLTWGGKPSFVDLNMVKENILKLDNLILIGIGYYLYSYQKENVIFVVSFIYDYGKEYVPLVLNKIFSFVTGVVK